MDIIGKKVETILGVGKVLAYHEITGQYQVMLEGYRGINCEACEWFFEEEVQIL